MGLSVNAFVGVISLFGRLQHKVDRRIHMIFPNARLIQYKAQQLTDLSNLVKTKVFSHIFFFLLL